MTPDSLVATVREKLQTLTVHYASRGRDYGYGFLIHQRWSGGPPAFGIITISGESLILTRNLLSALGRVDCWIYGAVPARLALGAADSGPSTSAIRTHSLAKWAVPGIMIRRRGRRRTGAGRSLPWPPNGLITPERLTQPMVFLTLERPIGWPG